MELSLDPRADVKLILREPRDEEDESDHQMNASSDVETDTSRILTIHVSSRHLVLTSKVFEAMLEGAFRESAELRKGSSTFSLNLPEDDPAAFLIVLNIIHGKNRQVPRKMTLEMLMKICIIVDKYGFHEALEVFADLWIKQLRLWQGFNPSSGDGLFSWMFISWVFPQPDIFENTTKIARLRSRCPLQESTSLPIPQSICDAIDQAREKCLDTVLTKIYGLVDKYRKPDKDLTPFDVCSIKGCGLLILGYLEKQMQQGGLGRVPPLPPYTGITLKAIKEIIKRMGDYPMYPAPEGKNHRDVFHRLLNEDLLDQIEYIKSHTVGLTLSDYTQKTSRKRAREDD